MDCNALIKTALDALQSGDPGRGEQLCRQVLQQEPRRAEALHLLGLARHARGKPAEATELIAEAVEQEPDNARYLSNLGVVLQATGRLQEAVDACRKAVRLDPGKHTAFNSLGIALSGLGRHEESEAAFRQAVMLAPDEPDFLGNLSVCLLGQGRATEAIQFIEAFPGDALNANLHHTHGLLLRSLDRHADAEQAQLQALKCDAGHTPSWLYLALLRRYDDPDHPDLQAMRALLKQKGMTGKRREYLHFGLGKGLEDCGDYEGAAAQFCAGNHIAESRMPWDAAAWDRRYARTMQVFTREFIQAHRLQASDPGPAPAFIIGMSRAGKSCLERLLARHPDISSGGELYALQNRSVQWLLKHWDEFPPAQMQTGLLQEAARRYLEFIELLAPDARYVTNTLNANTHHLGFIALLFPGARIIHLNRDPQDTQVSIYCKHYGDRGRYACRLNTIRTRMQQHEALMAHWRTVLPGPILEVHYADMVTRPAQTAGRVADFCGLDVTPALETAWNECGLDDRGIGRAGRFREFLETDPAHSGAPCRDILRNL